MEEDSEAVNSMNFCTDIDKFVTGLLLQNSGRKKKKVFCFFCCCVEGMMEIYAMNIDFFVLGISLPKENIIQKNKI